MLEAIRLTIINNMLEYHPVCELVSTIYNVFCYSLNVKSISFFISLLWFSFLRCELCFGLFYAHRNQVHYLPWAVYLV